MPSVRSTENEVRSATLAAAARFFASRGFEGATLQEIAGAVGVSKPAVLHHFPSKELLREAVLDNILDHWNGTLPRLLAAVTTTSDADTASHERFDAVFGELFRFFAADPDRARILLREMLDRPEEMRTILRRFVRPWLSSVAAYVRIGREAGRHYQDLDEDAYVLHVIQLVLMATACGTVTSSALEGDAAARYERELTRIARASLFSAPASVAPPALRIAKGSKRRR